MSTKRIVRWGIPGVIIGVVLFALAFFTVRANAQDQTTDDLLSRLKAKGVPINSLVVSSRIPFVVKIDLHSNSTTKALQPEDPYFAQIVRKAVALDYRHGLKIDGYELQITNAQGVAISWESSHFIPSETSQQSPAVSASKLSDADTQKVLQSALDFHGLTVVSLNVVSDQDLGDSAQEVSMQLSTASLATANQGIVAFIASLRSSLDQINTKNGARLAIVWVKVTDQNQQLLLNYVWDVETRQETSWSVPGLAVWYPVPMPIGTPTPAPAGANGAQGYPAPGPTPTNHPYP